MVVGFVVVMGRNMVICSEVWCSMLIMYTTKPPHFHTVLPSTTLAPQSHHASTTDHHTFLVRDETFELKYNFQLEHSLHSSSLHPLFGNSCFFITHNVQPPDLHGSNPSIDHSISLLTLPSAYHLLNSLTAQLTT